MTRLDTFASKLWGRIKSLPATARRKIVLAACRHAIDESGTQDVLLRSTFEIMSRGETLSADMQTALTERAEQLDRSCLDASSAEDSDAEDVALMAAEANAAYALSFAANESDIDAAAECLYEASCTSFDDEPFWNMILTLTSEAEPG